MDERSDFKLYKSLYREYLLDDGVITEDEEKPLADYASVVGLQAETVRTLQEEVRSEPQVAARLAELKGEGLDEPPDGPPFEVGDDDEGLGATLSRRRSQLRIMHGIAKDAGCHLSEVGNVCQAATCNATDPEVQERLRQAATEQINLEFAPLPAGPGGIVAVWPEAGRNLLLEVRAVVEWRMRFVPGFVTAERKLDRVRHEQGWLYFRAGRRQGIYARFGSKQGDQISVIVGFSSEGEGEDPVFTSASEAILAGCDPKLGEGWTLQQPKDRPALEAERVLTSEQMTNPGIVLSVTSALETLSGYVAEHLEGCTPREGPSLG